MPFNVFTGFGYGTRLNHTHFVIIKIFLNTSFRYRSNNWVIVRIIHKIGIGFVSLYCKMIFSLERLNLLWYVIAKCRKNIKWH